MKIIKFLIVALVLAMNLIPSVPTTLAADCTTVTYDSDGKSTYAPSKECTTKGECPSFTDIGGRVATYDCGANRLSCPPIITGQPIPSCSPASSSGIMGILLGKVFTTVFTFLITIASFTLLYAAFQYVTSEGEQEKIDTAKKMIIYAVIALIVAALAFGAPRAIQSFIL